MNIISYGSSCTGSFGVNGDIYYISPDNKVFILADGASGAGEAGKVLMGEICIEMVKSFDYSTSNLDAKDYIDKLLWKINNRLIEVSQEYKKLVFGTIDIAVFDKGILTITTIGDSPVFYFDGVEVKRTTKNKKKYEWMIDEGYITRDQYEGYIKNMHHMMWSCFDCFIPDIVPNYIIEQYEVKPNNALFMCSDGMSDWISKEKIFDMLNRFGLKDGIELLISESKKLANNAQNYFDDITAIAVKWIE
jgi:serine/threonine protein phosphatase PrpC